MYYDNILQLELTFCSISWAYRHMRGEWSPGVKLPGQCYLFNNNNWKVLAWMVWWTYVNCCKRRHAKKRKLLLRFDQKGTRAGYELRGLHTWMSSLRRSRQHLTHSVISAKRGKPEWFPNIRVGLRRWRYNTAQVKDDKGSESYHVIW